MIDMLTFLIDTQEILEREEYWLQCKSCKRLKTGLCFAGVLYAVYHDCRIVRDKYEIACILNKLVVFQPAFCLELMSTLIKRNFSINSISSTHFI